MGFTTQLVPRYKLYLCSLVLTLKSNHFACLNLCRGAYILACSSTEWVESLWAYLTMKGCVYVGIVSVDDLCQYTVQNLAAKGDPIASSPVAHQEPRAGLGWT